MLRLWSITFFFVVACAQGKQLQDIPYGSTRIINGETASQGEFPYVVSLRNSNAHFCGGSIIKSSFILTAAHCVAKRDASSVTVVAGSTTLDSGGNQYTVEKIIVHEEYNAEDSWKNDIALLKLSYNIIFSSDVSAILLPNQGEINGPGTHSTICGWGFTTYPGTSSPNELQKLSLTVTSNSVCQTYFKGQIIYPTNLCAGAGDGKGVCSRDSGGPLVSNKKQIGIVSWGTPCATAAPDIFTRVAQYINWINKNTQ